MIKYETETRLASPFPSVRVYCIRDGVKDREPIAIFPVVDTKDKAMALATLFITALDAGAMSGVRQVLGVSA